MMHAYKYLILFIICLYFQTNTPQTFVKVLIEKTTHNQIEPMTWLFESLEEFTIRLPQKTEKAVKKNFKKLKITVIKNKIYLDGKYYRFNSIKLVPGKAPISVNKDLYDGNFIICRDPKTNAHVFMINQVEIEDYICSVLKTESWPGWPIEVNKAFAIASRSYVLAQVLIARKSKLQYHIKNTNHHQTYSGIHNEQDIKLAVQETKSIILGHNNEPILAMFDSCCGGVIPAHIEGFDFIKYPYLERKERCNYCKKIKMYSWKASFSHNDFKKTIQEKTPGLKKIKKIVTNTDKAGTVKNLVVHGHSDQEIYKIDARSMYSLFKKIKSFCYSVNHKSNRIIIDGYGFGHHLGLCQWGAREMIRKGYTYKDILRFYYPGAKFMKFKDNKEDKVA